LIVPGDGVLNTQLSVALYWHAGVGVTVPVVASLVGVPVYWNGGSVVVVVDDVVVVCCGRTTTPFSVVVVVVDDDEVDDVDDASDNDVAVTPTGNDVAKPVVLGPDVEVVPAADTVATDFVSLPTNTTVKMINVISPAQTVRYAPRRNRIRRRSTGNSDSSSSHSSTAHQSTPSAIPG